MFLSGLGVGFRRAMQEHGADAGIFSPWMAASVWAGVGLLWHQSTSVVEPELIWLSAPIRLAM